MDRLWDSYEKFDSLVYVIDADTYEIVYLNRKARKTYQLDSYDDIDGRRCYELFRENAEPCASCVMGKTAQDKILEREVYNFRRNRRVQYKDTLVERDGKRYYVHISQPVDDGSEHVNGSDVTMLLRECMRLSLDEQDPKQAIRNILELVGQSLFADRCYIIETNGNGGTDNTFEWYAYRVEPQKENLQNIPMQRTQAWFDVLRRDENIVLYDLEILRAKDAYGYEFLHKQGITSMVCSPLWKNGELIGFIGMDNPRADRMENIDDMLKFLRHIIETLLLRRSLLQQLEMAGMYDQMTGFGNRYALKNMEQQLDKRTSLGVVYCDVCGLKQTNDTKGHKAGDELILRACECLKELFGDYSLFRIGGDELLALVPAIDKQELYTLCAQLRELSLSRDALLAVGCAWSGPGNHDIEALLSEADSYMYEDKKLFYVRHTTAEATVTDIRSEYFVWSENNPLPMYVHQAREPYTVLYANKKLLEIFECNSWSEFVSSKGGETCRQLIYEDDWNHVMETLRNIKESGERVSARLSFRIKTAKGKIKNLEILDSAVEHPAYGQIHVISVIDTDVSFKNYVIDNNTGLPGLQLFLNKLQSSMQHASAGKELQALYFNIVGFRAYNLRYGTGQGDMMLRKLTLFLQVNFAGDYIARLNGDHFAVLTSCKDAMARVNNVQELFALNYSAFSNVLKVGIYRMQENDSPLSVLDKAKTACESIRGSSELVRVYDEQISEKLALQSYILKNFETAMEKHHIFTAAQDIVRSINLNVCAVEALARWQSPEYGPISPADFIPVLEEKHLVYKLDLFVLREVLQTMSKNLSNPAFYEMVLPVSVNLSRNDFQDCDIFEEVEALMQEYGIERNMINIEVTESAVIADPVKMKEELCRFRNVGYHVWMDDFGSGYSSLNVLREYPFDGVKLDMTFLRNFDERSKSLVNFSVQLAKSLGMQTIAEGVETMEQLQFLVSIGCERMQGFLFGRPSAPEAGLNQRVAGKTELEHEYRYWSDFYDKVSAVRFDTDKGMAIVEWQGDYVHYMYVNDAYIQVRDSLSNRTMQQAEDDFNTPGSVYNGMASDLKQQLMEHDTLKEREYILHGYLIRVNVKVIAQKENRLLAHLELVKLMKVKEG